MLSKFYKIIILNYIYIYKSKINTTIYKSKINTTGVAATLLFLFKKSLI